MKTFASLGLSTLLAIFSAGLVTQTASAAPLCTYQAFAHDRTVSTVTSMLRGGLVNLVSLSPANSDANQSYAIFRETSRGQAQVGTLKTTRNRLERYVTSEFRDADDQLIIAVKESVFSCPEGAPVATCYETTIYQHNDERWVPSFAIAQRDNGLNHYRFWRPVNVTLWRSDYRDLLDWVVEVYHTTEGTETNWDSLSSTERVAYALHLDPDLGPWMGYVRLQWTNTGVGLSGVLPSNALHSILISRLLRQGVRIVSDWVVIDTGLLPPAPPAGIYPAGYCL